jgi:CheY-like chemotaxis protein
MLDVLVIEENDATRDILQKELSQLGCRVTVPESSENAMKLLEKTRFDVIITDLCMRYMSARSLARMVKERFPETKIFVITGWKGELDQKMLEKDGIHAVLNRPIVFSKLRGLIKSSILKRHLL